MTYTAFFPFCGLGGGALGFIQARASGAEFRAIGGIDIDAASCRDFETLTGAPALCADVARVTPAVLRAFVGERTPDVVFASPPCKGFSGLLSKKRSLEPKYQALNSLVLEWVRLMLSTWATPPRLFLLENVPRIASRGAALLTKVRARLTAAGYVLHESAHDCGELGGLAQHRRRFLLVARHAASVPALLHRPALQRVRGVGEVLEALPMPEDAAGGPMHRLPRLSWINWVRLALIPAGGDWRDLEGVLADGQPRREVHRRHRVERWRDPAATVAGSGSNGPSAVADPRIVPQSGDPSRTHWGKYKVRAFDAPTGTIAGAGRVGSGAESVADPRVRVAFDHGYAVLHWLEPSATVAAKSHPGCGAYSVADVRAGASYRGTYGVLRWQDAAATVTGHASPSTGRFSVADPRSGAELCRVHDARRPPTPGAPLIVAADGTWHRPLTTLELAALQGFPTTIAGAPLVLDGTSSTAWRERIGNAVPPPAARAIAEQMLLTLACVDGAGFRLAPTPVWVRRRGEVRA